ncbi:rod shape-determining protein RodA [Hydrogenobacter hydrogenophilus]|uniref:Rod shape determining protein RodA n=1 Tax=Hydrogenobacter hydrogenophilus TaxID=35835 RepID=A0A285NZN3_9AQUI|nr:rod shape-determining protein RodA [Hydrogenobacter hydrogenophilus]SNZ14393.1 rod shape determining protein RodA [Hydrogenobacter hydrogenophilus]
MRLKGIDLTLLICLLMIQLIGLLGVFSATYKGSISPLFVKQVLYILFGWLIILALGRINFRILYDMATVIYMLNLFLLMLVPLFGKTVYGAKRWLDLGPLSIQPSEFMKFSLLLFSTYILGHMKKNLSKESVILLLAFIMPTLLTLKQPDLGTAVSYLVILLSLLFFKGVRIRFFIALGLSLLILSPILWHFLKDYQKERIIAVLDPYADYAGSGYQLIQSMIAIGSGSITGKGFLKGTQSHLLFLPEKHTDFIFSVIAEEWGFLLSFLLISLYFLFIYRLALYGMRLYDGTQRLFLGGAVSLILFQVFVNLMMTMGLAPVVGIPLPFVSFGGSSVLTFSLIIGVCFSILREYMQKDIRFEEQL